MQAQGEGVQFVWQGWALRGDVQEKQAADGGAGGAVATANDAA